MNKVDQVMSWIYERVEFNVSRMCTDGYGDHLQCEAQAKIPQCKETIFSQIIRLTYSDEYTWLSEQGVQRLVPGLARACSS